MEVLPLAPKVGHHLMCHIQKIIHLHVDAGSNIIFGVFLFVISGSPVGDSFHRGDEKCDHQAEGKKDAEAKMDLLHEELFLSDQS